LLRHEAARTSREEDARLILRNSSSPNSILSAFPRIRGPDKELVQEASDDYVRCLLAKSVAEAHQKVTPKYRNEAARRQFFKKLATVSENIHLAQSPDRLHESLAGPGDDDAASWVTSQLKRMLDEKTDLTHEYMVKLNSARAEFRNFVKQLENIIGMNLNECERCRRFPTIDSSFPPGLFEDESTWRWGSQWDPEKEILNINPPVLFLDVVRKGVLAREAAVLLSPRIFDIMPDAPSVMVEQSEYVAYKLLERKNDKEFWAEARHGLRRKTRFRAHELIDFFLYYEMMVGDTLYRDLWSRLREFKNAPFTLSDYRITFNSLAARPTNPRFDRKELELVKLLSKKPEVRTGEVARLLHVSVPTAMKAIRDVSRKSGLRYTVIVDMQKLGLREYLLLINSNRQGEAIRVLTRFPFCRQVFRTYGSFDLFVVLDIPVEQSAFIRSFLDALTERGFVTAHKSLILSRDLQSVNFNRYDASRAGWDIHWDSWGIRLRESLGQTGSVLQYPQPEAGRYQFDKLDLNILFNLHLNCRAPHSALGRMLGVSGAYIGKKVEKMSRNHLFRYAVWPLKIGAEDWGLVALSCQDPVAATLTQYLSELPAWRGGFVTGDFDGLLSIVWAPNGELRQFLKAVDDRVIRGGHAQAVCMNSIGEWVVARWLPVSPDDPWQLATDDGGWLFDSERYLSLVR
jgi:DNA-binding Lrp family transcriptional regulator